MELAYKVLKHGISTFIEQLVFFLRGFFFFPQIMCDFVQ